MRFYSTGSSVFLAGQLQWRPPRDAEHDVGEPIAVEFTAAEETGQPTSLRGTTIPHLRQWQPQRIGGR